MFATAPSPPSRRTLIALAALSLPVAIALAVVHPLLPVAAALALGALALVPQVTTRGAFVGLLCGMVVLLDPTPGIQAPEALYALVFLGSMGAFLFTRLAYRPASLVQDTQDVLLWAFLAWCTFSIFLAPFFGASMGSIPGQFFPILLFLFYFPIRDGLREGTLSPKTLIAVFLVLVLYALGRNMWEYYKDFSNAQFIWQVLNNRERTNERYLMVALAGSVAMYLFAPSRKQQAFALGFSGLFLFGVLIGQSRATWLASIIALSVLFLMGQRKERLRMLWTVVAGALFLVVLAAVLFGPQALLIAIGLGTRAASIQGVGGEDISVLARYVEWGTVLEHIRANPIIGYGYGKEYFFFDVIGRFTIEKSHIHSTYLALWYRHGLVGLALFFGFVSLILLRVVPALRAMREGDPLRYALGIACLAGLTGLGVAGLAEDMLTHNEGTFLILFLLATLAGLIPRRQL